MWIDRGLMPFLLASMVLFSIFSAQQVSAGHYEFYCGDSDRYTYRSCDDHGGWKCEDDSVVSTLSKCIGRGGAASEYISVCGDGEVDPGESCDIGSQNSDNEPNTCRTDCRTPYCGDGVIDMGEECDDVNSNNPNSCRPNCRLPVCGDGIHDNAAHMGMPYVEFNEECDDGNSNDLDGCKSDCSSCLRLTSNIDVSSDLKLCGDVFNVPDYGDEGVLIVKFPGVTVDCDGATLQGSGVGAGIFVKMANDVTIKNCTITGYAAGVKAVNSQNVIFPFASNNFNGNTQAYVMENSSKTVVMEGLQSSTDLPPITDPALVTPKASDEEEGKKDRRSRIAPTPGTQPAVMAPTAKPLLQAAVPGKPSTPVIVYPRSGQRFPAPTAFTAKVASKGLERLVYTVKNVGGKRYLKQSSDGRFAGIPAGDYCVEAAYLKTPGSPGVCVKFKVAASPTKPAPLKALTPALPAIPTKPTVPVKPTAPVKPLPTTKPLTVAPPTPAPAVAVAKLPAVQKPYGTLVTEQKRTYLNMNVAIARAEVFAGVQRLGQLPGGKRLEITAYVPKALKGELIFHYFDAKGVKTVQKVNVGSVRR